MGPLHFFCFFHCIIRFLVFRLRSFWIAVGIPISFVWEAKDAPYNPKKDHAMNVVFIIIAAAPVFKSDVKTLVATIAASVGYTVEELRAGVAFSDRKARRCNPPGEFDKAGRYYAEERTDAVQTCRSPSRAFPYPEMAAARTAAQCSQVFEAQSLLAVKRVAKALDALEGVPAGSAHEMVVASAAVVGILKPVKR